MGASENLKILFWTTEHLSMPLDRTRRVALGPRIGDLDQVAERITAGITKIGCQSFNRKILVF
jgi:hypothetical protein